MDLRPLNDAERSLIPTFALVYETLRAAFLDPTRTVYQREEKSTVLAAELERRLRRALTGA